MQFVNHATICLFLLSATVSAKDQMLLEFFEQNEVRLRKVEAAFECAAFASGFDNAEHGRLLGLAIEEGRAAMLEILPLMFESLQGDLGDAMDPEQIQSWDDLPWEATPYGTRAEAVAF